jgi:hypothetical protein
MRKWIGIGIVAMCSCFVEAQVTFGGRAGVSYASLTQIVDEEITYGGHVGFSVAGLMDIPLSPKFSLRPELAFVNLGGTYYIEYVSDRRPYLDMERRKCNYYSIQVPVNFTYKIHLNNWRFGVYGGPSVSVSTQVREKGFQDEREFRPVDIGAGAGLYVQHRQVFCSIYTHTGFLDRQTRKQPNESQLYQNNVTLSFGYWFRIYD